LFFPKKVNEMEIEEKPAVPEDPSEKRQLLANIERLWIEGYANQEIADELQKERRVIGRNLREIKKRHARAAARQKTVLSQTQCATVYREAMNGWQRSQQPKLTTTKQREDEEEGKITTRSQEGPGDKTFLQAAVSALNSLRRFTADKEPAKSRPISDRELLLLTQILTQEQLETLDDVQIQRFREAIDRFRADHDAHRRQEHDRQDGPALVHATNQAELSGELAPRGPGEHAGPGGDGRL